MPRIATLMVFAAALLPAQERGTQEPQGGPTQLIITYRCPPPRRAAFRQYMTEMGLPRFERWKREGVLADYRLLFNWYVDVDTWDAMAVLSFADYQAAARWKDIEKTSPGGLARDAIDMAWPLNTYPADLIARESAGPGQDAARSVFFVIPYDFTTPAAYRDYVNTLLLPQIKGWMREGVLAGYSAFSNHYPGGKRWQGLLVLEYKDLEAFARRDEVMAKVRAQLRADSAWKNAESKQSTNPEREPVVADAVVAH